MGPHDEDEDVINEKTNLLRGAQDEEDNSTDKISFSKIGREKQFALVTMFMANFCMGAFYSLLAPFFPNEAAKKDVSSTEVGLIFGVFELVIVLVSPLYGKYMTKIGAKFLYVTGALFCGACSILFGFLDESPPGTPYVVMCFVVRSFEALGAAAFTTASYAILANMFPNNVASLFGALETCGGIGMMVGPPLGGALFEAGGFKLPFISTGTFLMLIAIVSIKMLPSLSSYEKHGGGSMLSLIRIPLVIFVNILIFTGSSAIGYLDATFSVFLEEKFMLSPTALGAVFLAGPGMYTLSAPLWGIIGDKMPKACKPALIIGYLLGGTSFLFLAPTPFLHFKTQLWTVIVAQLVMGCGIGTLVLSFQEIIEAARAHGFPNSLSTYGLVSGMFTSVFSFGAFLGPVAGGYLNDVLGFAWSSAVIAALNVLGGVLLLLYVIISPCCTPASMPFVAATEDQVDTEYAPILSDTDSRPSSPAPCVESRPKHIQRRASIHGKYF